MIRGETVVVECKIPDGVDAYNHAKYATAELPVENVLVAPQSSSDVIDGNRTDGAEVRYKLHFPKTYIGKLDGLRVKVRDEWLHVVGSPRRYTAENTPGRWNMEVEVGVVNG